MSTRETELPGIGTKHTIDLTTDEELVVVEHRSGHWELARVDKEGATTQLTQLQAREGNYAVLQLPSGELRRVHVKCRATRGSAATCR